MPSDGNSSHGRLDQVTKTIGEKTNKCSMSNQKCKTKGPQEFVITHLVYNLTSKFNRKRWNTC